jgi:hypothetical protein
MFSRRDRLMRKLGLSVAASALLAAPVFAEEAGRVVIDLGAGFAAEAADAAPAIPEIPDRPAVASEGPALDREVVAGEAFSIDLGFDLDIGSIQREADLSERRELMSRGSFLPDVDVGDLGETASFSIMFAEDRASATLENILDFHIVRDTTIFCHIGAKEMSPSERRRALETGSRGIVAPSIVATYHIVEMPEFDDEMGAFAFSSLTIDPPAVREFVHRDRGCAGRAAGYGSWDRAFPEALSRTAEYVDGLALPDLAVTDILDADRLILQAARDPKGAGRGLPDARGSMILMQVISETEGGAFDGGFTPWLSPLRVHFYGYASRIDGYESGLHGGVHRPAEYMFSHDVASGDYYELLPVVDGQGNFVEHEIRPF